MAVDTADLAGALRQAKNKLMFFVFVAKGSDGALHVDKKKVPNKVANDAKKECGGGIIYKGTCQFEEGTCVFQVANEPPATLAGLIKKIIKRDASMMLNVEVRANQALAQAGEGEEEQTDQERQSIPNAPPLGPPPLATKFAARLKALAPVVQTAEKLGGTLVVQAKQRIAEGNKYYRDAEYSLANTSLDDAEAFIKQAFAENKSSNGATRPTGTDPLAAKFAVRLKALTPVMQRVEGIKNAHAKDAKLAFTEANTFFRAKNYADANATLDIVEELLKEAFAAKNGPLPGSNGARQQPNPTTAKEKLAASLKVWAEAKDQADAEINALISALKKTGDAALADIANGMGLSFSKFKVGLTAALMNFDASPAAVRRQAYSKVSTILTAYRQHLETDNFIAGADANPLGVKVNIRRSMLAALDQVKANVDAAMI